MNYENRKALADALKPADDAQQIAEVLTDILPPHLIAELHKKLFWYEMNEAHERMSRIEADSGARPRR